jgi:hypothetical protein
MRAHEIWWPNASEITRLSSTLNFSPSHNFTCQRQWACVFGRMEWIPANWLRSNAIIAIWSGLSHLFNRSDIRCVWCLNKSACVSKTFYKLKTNSCLMCAVALILGDKSSFSPPSHQFQNELIVCFPSYYIAKFDYLFSTISYLAWFSNLWWMGKRQFSRETAQKHFNSFVYLSYSRYNFAIIFAIDMF